MGLFEKVENTASGVGDRHGFHVGSGDLEDLNDLGVELGASVDETLESAILPAEKG